MLHATVINPILETVVDGVEQIRLELGSEEILAIRRLLVDLKARYGSAENEEFLRNATLFAHEMPMRVRKLVHDFKQLEPRSAVLVVAGFPIEESKIGDTPDHWKNEKDRERVVEEEIYLVLIASLLGECIGWATQQAGRIVHDIAPIEAHREEQLGSGSEQLLWWHTEDAFHPYRGDYIGMLCLRNPDAVPTTFANLRGLDELSDEHRKLLFEPHYTIRPDESHQAKNKSDAQSLDASYEEIEKMNQAPEKIAVLFGDPAEPYARLDPYFMDPVDDPPEAQQALEALIAILDRDLKDLTLEQGDVCFIDNFQGVHGRKPFTARYDGTDRWMKRVNVVRDMRKSRPIRASATSRIMT